MPRYDWDDAKAAANLAKHGVAFESVVDLEWPTALIVADERHEEPRYYALGLIGTRLHTLVFTWRGGWVRVISLRKSNAREIRRFEDG